VYYSIEERGFGSKFVEMILVFSYHKHICFISTIVSLGTRYQQDYGKQGQCSITTLALTPMTGHFSSTYTILPSLVLGLSTRFDFNLFNHESNLHLGMEYRRDSNTLIRTSINAESGLSLYLEKKLKNIRLGAHLGFPILSLIHHGVSLTHMLGIHILYQPS
jgi:hypothetical protein